MAGKWQLNLQILMAHNDTKFHLFNFDLVRNFTEIYHQIVKFPLYKKHILC